MCALNMDERINCYYLRLRGLPWSATKQDIHDFLKNVKICEGDNSLLFTLTEEGKRSGDALVMVPTQEDYDKALTYNRNYIGKRYIEVLPSDSHDYALNLEKVKLGEDDYVVRLRGLPYATTETDIREFFKELQITEQGVIIILDKEGRCSGDAYVEFLSAEHAQEALKKHREKITNRFIEIFRSSRMEMSYVKNKRPTPLMSINLKRTRGKGSPMSRYRTDDNPVYYSPSRRDRNRDPYGHGPIIEKYIHMRGLPFECIEEEVEDFFAPVPLVSIGFCYNQDGRFNGECDVYFETDSDSLRAMNKDKKKLGKRYVELFLRTRRIHNVKRQADYYPTDRYRDSLRKYPPPPPSNHSFNNYRSYPPSYSGMGSNQTSKQYSENTNPIDESQTGGSQYPAVKVLEYNSQASYLSGNTNVMPQSEEYYNESTSNTQGEMENRKTRPQHNYREQEISS
ncbi:hypothetical protein HZS_5907, partial [Henneguya salminicola]